MAKKEVREKSVLENLRETVNKHYGDEVILVASEYKVEKVPTGVFSIDLETEGGIPRGRAIILVGEESTFKSTLMYIMAGRFQRICGNCMTGHIREFGYKKMKAHDGRAGSYIADSQYRNLYCPGEQIAGVQPLFQYELECTHCNAPKYSAVLIVDSEKNYTRQWAQKFGIVHAEVVLARTEYSEQAGDVIREAMNTGRISFVGVDSLDASGPKIEEESSVEDQQMGVQARVWNKITRILHSKLNKRFTYEYTNKAGTEVEVRKPAETTVCIIQQWRQKIGGYGDPRVLGGGLGKGYMSTMTMATSKGEKEWTEGKKGERKLNGVFCNFELIKHKAGTPYRAGKFYFSTTGQRILNEETILDYALRYKIVGQSGAWYDFGKMHVQGRDAVVEEMRSNASMRKVIEQKVLQKAVR